MSKEDLAKKRVGFEAILFEFIEPLVVLYKQGKTYYVASALPSEAGFVQEYLVVSVTPKYLKRYFREECDLRFLFVSARNRRYFKLNASQTVGKKVEIVEFDGNITEDMLPDPQFFASNHSHKYKTFSKQHDALEALLIDGNWEMEDFGIFSSRYRDIYSFEDSLRRIESDATPESQVKKIHAAFKGHSLRGGGSYVNFFRDLTNAIPANDQYELNRVQYASPGRIELNGRSEIFDLVEKRIKNTIEGGKPLHDAYWDLYRLLSDSGLLDITKPSPTPKDGLKDSIEKKTAVLLHELKLDMYSRLKELTEHNTVNTAKLSLAIYRRLKSASSYFAEGRVVYEQ